MKRILSLILLCALLLSATLPHALAADNQTAPTEPEDVKPETKEAAAWDIDGDGTLSLLAIGNSFSVDGLQYFWNIARSVGVTKVVLGNLYIGGCSLATHYTNAKNDSAAYTYYYNDSGTWKTTSSYKMSTAIQSRSWDFISMQQNSGNSGLESTYNSNLTNLISYVKGKLTNSKTKLVWHMTWAYQSDSTHSSFANYSNNQTTMYNGIVTAVTNKILTNSNFDRVIPNGTAVQNMRSSYVGDTLTRDGYHMSYDQGRFLVALMFVKAITGLDVSKNTYRPSGVSDTYAYVAVNAVNKAYSAPLKISKSVYSGNNPSSGYIELVPTMTKGAYWHSTTTNYNKLVTSSTINHRFWATHRFTKDELPVGTIILAKSGWQYRPEGWITDAQQTSREDVTAEKLVVVTENWWKSYTLRAFNISKTDNSDLTSMTAAEVLTNFRIFVPESIYLKNHIQIKPDLNKGAYWNPTKAGAFNTIITNASNSPNFYCTPRFTKAQLPVGSVILVKSSYQYRPDGWVNDVLQTGTRETVVTRYSTIVSSSWWGSYTIRAFNISLRAGGEITGKTQADIYNNFKIYVPKSSHTHTPASNPVVTAPTCTAGGYTTYTCTMCKQTYTGTQTAALGHALNSVVTAPTCTADGYTTHTCTRCNQVTVGDPVPALGHSLVSDVTAPSCTVGGYTTYTCTTCHEVTTGDLTPALGHSIQGFVTPPTCTEDGYTTYTCSVCHETTIGDTTSKLGHDFRYQTGGRENHVVSCSRCDHSFTEPHVFTEGVCICQEVDVLEPVLSTALKIGHSLNLASDISVNLVVAKSTLEGFDMSTVYMLTEVESYDTKGSAQKSAVTLYPVEQGDYYYFTLEGLTAVAMMDQIRSVLYGTKDGQVYYSTVDAYSVADYAYSQMNKATIPTKLKVLCADLLRYGTAAQIYKNYRTDSLADGAMTQEQRAYLSDISQVTFGSNNTVLEDLEQPAVSWVGKALELNSKVALLFAFDIDDSVYNVDDLRLEVSYTDRLGEKRTVMVSDPEPYTSTAGRYVFSFDGLLAAELRTVVSVRVCNGQEYLSRTLLYSADTYGGNKTGNLGNLCKALFAYSDSAKAYFPGNN